MNVEYLTYTNHGFIEFAKNNIKNFADKFDKSSKLTVVALDGLAFKELKDFITYDNITLKEIETDIVKEENFNSANFIAITKLKLKIIYYKLKKCEALHFFDGDVFFLKSPESIIKEKIINNDIVFQQDSPRNDKHPLYSNYVCTGNFTLKSNDRVFSLLQKLLNVEGNFNDQEILYNYLNSKCNNIKEFNECILDIYDPVLFQNGYDAFKYNWYKKEDAICIHANHMVGKQTKIDSLKKINAWLI